MVAVNLLVEGPVDEAVVKSIIRCAGLDCGEEYGRGRGKQYILSRLDKYNRAANYSPWIAVVDLDHSHDCVSQFVQTRLPNPAPGMCFRVAVRAIEAWLMADSDRLASYLGVSVSRIPINPDEDDDPKSTLVNLARRSSRRDLRRDMVPDEGSGAKVGPAYTSRVIQFVNDASEPWRPEVAAHRSDSLMRCLRAVQALTEWNVG